VAKAQPVYDARAVTNLPQNPRETLKRARRCIIYIRPRENVLSFENTKQESDLGATQHSASDSDPIVRFSGHCNLKVPYYDGHINFPLRRIRGFRITDQSLCTSTTALLRTHTTVHDRMSIMYIHSVRHEPQSTMSQPLVKSFVRTSARDSFTENP
jgi:hypothetical protein